MNKKTLSVLLILCMLLTMVPVTALAEDVAGAEPVAATGLTFTCAEDCTTETAVAYVIANNSTEATCYGTLQGAVTAASVGNTVTLMKPVELTQQVTINKAITLDGADYGITTSGITGTAAILVTAGATVQNVTVSGPNTTASGWDGGEYGIKVYNATGVTLSNVAVTAANAGILVSSSDATMTGTITVSGNEYGGIEVSKASSLTKAGNLNITDATIVCADENVPAIWIDGTTASEGVVTGGNYPSITVGEQIYYATSQELLNKIAANNGIVAIANGTGYKTLQAAVDVNNNKVTMLADATEDVTIPAGKTITLDLNGKKLTNVSGDTITIANGASLTITGEGTVDNITHQKAAIYNNGTTVLNGGYYYRSKETGVDADTSGGNSYYTILNHGAMTINAGVTIEQCGKFSSMIDNGYYSYNSTNPRSGYVSGTNMANPTLTINGGSFNGGINTVKNDDGATLTITDGTFENATQAVVQNHNIATISGGTFSTADGAPFVIDNCPCDAALDKGEFTISGGTFTGAIQHRPSGEYGFVKLSGGTYNAKPAADYVEKGKGIAQIKDGDYTGYYEVKTIDSTDVTTAVDVAKPDVEVSENSNIDTNKVEEVTAIAGSVRDNETNGLATKADNIVVSEVEKQAALTALSTANIDTNGKEVTAVVVPYFDIQVKAYDATETEAATALTLDIKPMYNLKATTNPGEMIEEPAEGETKNTVTLNKEPLPMTITDDITLSVELPAGFKPQVVKHEHEGSVNYYPVQISEKSGSDGKTKVATFTVKDGFSDFTFMADARKATINFDKEIANGDKKAIYGINALGTKLPTVSGNFIGWKINGTTYTTLTEELWNAIAGKEVDAVAQFSSSGSSSGGSSSGGGAAIANKVTVTTPDSDVNVSHSAVSSSVINDVKDAVADDKNVQVVGGSSNTVNITAKQDGNTLTSFDNPLTVTVPVSSNVLANVKDTSKLTLAQVTKDANGEIVLTYVGGNYNADKKTFTAYVDEPGNYVLLADADVQKIELQIGDKASTVNGRTVMNDVAPIIVNDRTMIPLRFVSEALGAQVDWNEAARTVTIKQDGVTMRMTIDKMIDGFNAAPIIRNSRTMVPVRYIAEKLGANVIYVPITQEIIVVR